MKKTLAIENRDLKIETLEQENAELKAMLADLVRYLNTPKFAQDPTVQVADVLTRIGAR